MSVREGPPQPAPPPEDHDPKRGHDPDKVRGAIINLRTPFQRLIFFGGLVAIVLLVFLTVAFR